MLKSLDDLWTDRVFRMTYGDDIGYNSETGSASARYGVGTIENGPSIPRVSVPDGQISAISTPVQSIPAAFASETVLPKHLLAKKPETYSKSEVQSAANAQARLKSYIKSLRKGS